MCVYIYIYIHIYQKLDGTGRNDALWLGTNYYYYYYYYYCCYYYYYYYYYDNDYNYYYYYYYYTTTTTTTTTNNNNNNNTTTTTTKDRTPEIDTSEIIVDVQRHALMDVQSSLEWENSSLTLKTCLLLATHYHNDYDCVVCCYH